MSRQIITLLKKDLVLFTRDRFYFLMTVLGLAMYFIVYFVMPSTLNETMKLGVYAPGIPEVNTIDATLARDQGIDLKVFDSIEDLRDAVQRNEYPSAIVLPEGFLAMLQAGERPAVTLYFSASAPQELRTAVSVMIDELASQASGQQDLLDLQTEVLGPDLAGNQIPWRNRLIPILIVLILGTEVLSMASLISTELEQKTIRALLVTPLRLNQLLSEKALLGISMAFIQVLLFVLIIGGLTSQPLTMILVLLVGSIMVMGLGFLVASLARDLMGVTAWGMIVLIIFVIPGIGAMIPGLLASWAKIIPSYPLTDSVSQLVNYGAGFGAVSGHILAMLGWSAAFAAIGVFTLRRRYAWASGN